MRVLKLYVFKPEFWEVMTAPVGEIPEKDFLIRSNLEKNQEQLLDNDNNPIHYDAVLLVKGFSLNHPRMLIEFMGTEKIEQENHVFSNGAEINYIKGPYWKVKFGKVIEVANFTPQTRYWKGREVLCHKFPKEEFGTCVVKRVNESFIAVEFEKPLPIIYNEGRRNTIVYPDMIQPAS